MGWLVVYSEEIMSLLERLSVQHGLGSSVSRRLSHVPGLRGVVMLGWQRT